MKYETVKLSEKALERLTEEYWILSPEDLDKVRSAYMRLEKNRPWEIPENHLWKLL